MAPWDPPDRLSRVAPSRPRRRTARCPTTWSRWGARSGFGANGAVSNLGVFHYGVNTMRRELRAGGFDVVHVHEPEAPVIGWDACSFRGAPVVGTFHAYSTKPLPNCDRERCSARGASSTSCTPGSPCREAAAWTGRRWFGGTLPRDPQRRRRRCPAARARSPSSDELRRALRRPPRGAQGPAGAAHGFEGLIEHVPARSTVDRRRRATTSSRYLADPAAEERIDALGRVADDELWRRLHEADVLCAPSLARRELRDGPDRGLRGRHARDRLRHRRLRRRRDATASTACSSRRPTRSASPRSCSGFTSSRQRRAADGRGRARARPALRLAARRRAGRGGLRAGAARRRSRATATERIAAASGLAPIDGSPRAPARSACPRSTPRRRRRWPAPRPRARRRSASPACSASASPRSPRSKIGLQNVVARASSAPTPALGADRDRADHAPR